MGKENYTINKHLIEGTINIFGAFEATLFAKVEIYKVPNLFISRSNSFIWPFIKLYVYNQSIFETPKNLELQPLASNLHKWVLYKGFT